MLDSQDPFPARIVGVGFGLLAASQLAVREVAALVPAFGYFAHFLWGWWFGLGCGLRRLGLFGMR